MTDTPEESAPPPDHPAPDHLSPEVCGPDGPAGPVAPQEQLTPGGALPGRGSSFHVHLDVFDGPFDLLLGLISKHKLDVTEIALAQVTDEFIAYIRAYGVEWDLGEASEFLLVAATLLDLKAARLLPSAQVEDDEDLALLEARDLLFARLLQYRAFKQVAATLSERLAREAGRFPRSTALEPQFAKVLPELIMGITPDQLAAIAGRAMTPKPPPVVGLEHLHAPTVSVREQAAVLVDRLRKLRSASFRALIGDAEEILVVVARFLALLELFREGAVAFDQMDPLGDLTVRWTGTEDGAYGRTDEFEGSAPAGDQPVGDQPAGETNPDATPVGEV
ncbi:MAG: segregation/condensation protein [Actinomycetota bacterium]|nr:segregation/condensation protein [Actinomycetota bacterium]